MQCTGYPDLMAAMYGEKMKYARAVIGMSSLPDNIAVEIDLIVEVFKDWPSI